MANAMRANPLIMVQNTTTILDNIERLIIEAIKARPDVLIAITADEFGIGTNEHARITGYVLEDEKVLKTVHFAIGDNYDFDANGILHQDGLVMSPIVRVDGRMIMEDGDILL